MCLVISLFYILLPINFLKLLASNKQVKWRKNCKLCLYYHIVVVAIIYSTSAVGFRKPSFIFPHTRLRALPIQKNIFISSPEKLSRPQSCSFFFFTLTFFLLSAHEIDRHLLRNNCSSVFLIFRSLLGSLPIIFQLRFISQ